MPTRAETQKLLDAARSSLEGLGAGALDTADDLAAATAQSEAAEVALVATKAELATVKQQLADCQDNAPPDPDPPPDPPPTSTWPAFPEASRLGTVIAEDINAPATPGPWLRQSTPETDGSNPNDDFLVKREESGLWTAYGKTAPLTHSREHIAPASPPQSVYDRENTAVWPAPGSKTRCQLQKWSNGNAFWTGHEGDHVFICFGFRVMPTPPLSKPVGGGQPGYTQLVQWKARNDSYSEVDSIGVGSDGIQFEFSSHPGNVEQRALVKDVPHGLWHRVVIETLVSTRGKHAFWIQPNGKPWRKVGEWNVGTIPGTATANYRSMGVGPYHQIQETTRNRHYWARYAGLQIIRAK